MRASLRAYQDAVERIRLRLMRYLKILRQRHADRSCEIEFPSCNRRTTLIPRRAVAALQLLGSHAGLATFPGGYKETAIRPSMRSVSFEEDLQHPNGVLTGNCSMTRQRFQRKSTFLQATVKSEPNRSVNAFPFTAGKGADARGFRGETTMTFSDMNAGIWAGRDLGIKHRYIEIDDVSIFYRDAGPLDAPVVLLPHGYPSSSFQFRNFMPALADRWRLIAPDFPASATAPRPMRHASPTPLTATPIGWRSSRRR